MTTFRELHHRGEAFVMPNPWDVGSARILTSLGFEALATTSAGFAHSIGKADAVRAVSRDEVMAHARELCEATHLPVNGDLERGYGDEPEDVAETIRLAAAAGLAGGSIEDATGDLRKPIYDHQLALARVEAAVEAARSVDGDFVLTARAENHLYGLDDFDDTVHRLQSFEAAGADVLYAPGLPDLETIRSLCSAVGRPVNVLASPTSTVEDLSAAGVARISLGSALSRAAYGALLSASREILDNGTFTGLRDAAPFADLNRLFYRRS